mmetsp:Transcript_61014/g.176685  ORF Transcript_61014/g.176685 Transcript_61014/m.176685 type:complete len:228 (-) Transcript_61014:185-868(-)
MLSNTRSRTVFAFKHKYSSDALEEEPAISETVVKKKAVTFVGRQVCEEDFCNAAATATSRAGLALLRGVLATDTDSGGESPLVVAATTSAAPALSRTLRPVSAPAHLSNTSVEPLLDPDEVPGSPMGALGSTCHLAGTLSRSRVVKDAMRARPSELNSHTLFCGGGGDAVAAATAAAGGPVPQPSPNAELCYCSSFVPIDAPLTPALAGSVLLNMALSAPKLEDDGD